ncbi:MAG: glycoside hydrolase family 3 C-terminal domain-containing protein [Chloroflexota bacterium]|nr:glycoside hydrolase family 3 C-terminal domain-containing protein [Chloroflexota bacterium]
MTSDTIDARARELLAQMTLNERIHEMSGTTPLWRAIRELLIDYNFRAIPSGGCKRLGIPPLLFTDGPRGVVLYHSTCFPVAIARGATWDTGLEARVGNAIGIEARSQGANLFAGVCINVLRHPAWGRAQETYGEDPYLLGEMGVALVRSVQQHLLACVKHFATNSIENARFKVDVRIDQRTLREVYLPHFKRCVDAGVACVMSAYNKVNGEYCGQHRTLLRDILKGEWGFDGFVMTDFFFGARDGKAAALGGQDMEMPLTRLFGKRLKRLVESGAVPQAVVDESVLRILRQKLRFSTISDPQRYPFNKIDWQAHRALAREAAQKAMVLLKNENPHPKSLSLMERDFNTTPEPPLHEGEGAGGEGRLLPIDLRHTRRIAVIGKLATARNLGDRGSSKVRAPYGVTPLQGIRAAAQSATVTYADGKDIEAAVLTAREADVVIVVAGYGARDEGEYVFLFGGDRDSLTLKPHDEALIQAVAAANPRTAVVMIGGSPIVTDAWRERVPALLMAWYAGMEGGHALADVLFGAVNPSGKLPCSFPSASARLPHFDKYANTIDYGYYHGYWLHEREQQPPAFAFGYGLSYTRYRYDDLQVSAQTIGKDDTIEVSVAITNAGERAGDEIAQLYAGVDDSTIDRPIKKLVGFQKLHLEVGETQRAVFRFSPSVLATYDVEHCDWQIEAGTYRLYAGASSRAGDLLETVIRVG